MSASSSLKSVALKDAGGSHLLRGERDAALSTLVEDSVFQPVGSDSPGPYTLTLGIVDGRLLIEMTGADGVALPALILSLKPYTRLVRDYFMMIESYEKMRREGSADQLETVDMARRGLHEEGASLLTERLSGKIAIDHQTARRLFTLICILHGQHVPLF